MPNPTVAFEPKPTPEHLEDLRRSRRKTLAALSQVEDSTLIRLTRLTLPEIQAIREEIAQVFPAGNLLAFVLSGLVKLEGRRLAPDRVRQDLAALFRGLDILPRGLYGVFIAGPAAVLYAYRKLLELAGKDLDSAFPQGTWQFYLEFGMREDTARHAVETVGFHQALTPAPDPVSMAAAWVYAILEMLYGYDDLLAADWTERVMLRLAREEAEQVGLADQPAFSRMAVEWGGRLPYHLPPDVSDYLPYRSAAFQRFLDERLSLLPEVARQRFYRRYELIRDERLAAYQQQMTLLSMLKPERYQEIKQPLPLWRAAVGFVWQERTYLLSACRQDAEGRPLCQLSGAGEDGTIPLDFLPNGRLCDGDRRPLTSDRSGRVWYEDGQLLGYLCLPAPEEVLGWLSEILSSSPPDPAPDLDLLLVEAARSAQLQLRGAFPDATQDELAALRHAPVIINWDQRPHDLPLATVRQARRGIGDHALTLFRTDRSLVFDHSHIFFDGVWAMSVAEITADSAVRWLRRLAEYPPAVQAPPDPLALVSSRKVDRLARAHRSCGEATAESDGVDMERLRRLRKWLQQRGISLTVNDLLLLYRSIHAMEYEPSPRLERALGAFRQRAKGAEARKAVEAIEATLARFRETNPALLIPMDASNVSPRERVFPTTFRNPLVDIRDRLADAQARYRAYRADPALWAAFDDARRELLAYLDAFGELLDVLKAVTRRGESFNTASIRLLAHLPPSMQSLLDQIPQRIGVLNEVVKGNEVFSNVGRVAPGATLTRFISAKDDGETKELVWGILTDDQGRMQISLRDFRPFVPMLLALGEAPLADLLAQDYLEGYFEGFNRFLVKLETVLVERSPGET